MTTVVAVDGGKSALRVRVADSEGGCWEGSGPGFTYRDEASDLDAVVTAVDVAVHRTRAAATAGSPFGGIDAACFGLTGIPGAPEERAALVARLEAVFAAEILLLDDATLAHAGALAGPGTVVSVGTGTIALSIDAEGRPRWGDGWGPILGDRGSAYAIGRSGMRAGAAALDGSGPPSLLAEHLLRVLGGTTSLAALQHFYRSYDAIVNVSEFARNVLAASDVGDVVAARILEDAAEDLAATVAASAATGQPVSHAGRLIGGSPGFLGLVTRAIERRGLHVAEPRGDALDGGILLARELAQGSLRGSFYDRAIRAWQENAS